MQFLELLKISRESKMFVVNAGWGEEGGGEKFLSSFAKQRNIAQRFSVANNNKNFTDITQLLLQFLFYVDILFFFFFQKVLKTCMVVIKGMNTKPVCGSLNVMLIAVSPGFCLVPDTQWLVIGYSIS